ncbi:glycosyltransferase [Cyanobacterium sp. IPPAS B-1200]|uniref:glycosyltransferase n=1 Tax=Cyanobacterium sp. IPPAS B-1200 TaxID=1562720 RepID=UPI000852839D|nr:glycosyltransferase [Cyanobacterium sp. IPPAS B-1200]OEJ79688.1 glycosyl transferase family 1 [Cyanobacterium sp. IPPAS B-1200]
MKTALVHEWLTPKATGGSELVVKEILELIDAQLYALIDFESSNPQSYLYGRKIGTSFLQHFPLSKNGVQKYLPLLPIAIEQLNLTEYDLVLSSSHAVAKGIITRPDQLHICYCHTPMRYAWDLTFDYLDRTSALKGFFARYILHQLRQWDVISANRVDYFIANSHHTARRIWRCYRREAEVIYPPVQVDEFPFEAQKSDFYVIVSRLVSYKKVSLIVEAFNKLGKPLVVIGDGPEFKSIEAIAKPNITLLGSVDDITLKKYLSSAKAFIYGACEDFGIAIVEAQACGTPVIAYKGGGALETVIDMETNPDTGTGVFFPSQTVDSLIDAVNTFENLAPHFRAENCLINAQKFSLKIFQDSYQGFVDQCLNRFSSK